jgi:lipopolysaccharide/colanic/teichoic acid biosynthesis glycosyltransferase
MPEQLLNMTENEKKRYNIKPGLTGLSQISGNIHLSWKERYKLDLVYVNNITFLNDFKILFRTIFIVIKGEEKFLNKPFQIRRR